MQAIRPTIWSLAAAALLAGCASGVKLDEVPVESRSGSAVGAGAGSGSAGTSGATSQSQVASVDLGKGGSAAQAGLARIIYFDFDSFVVKDEFRPVVESHARQLGADRRKQLMIEGHADERGGREYNLALGQKRAEAVRKSLVLLGATDAQLEAVSYGEERPAVQGSTEDAWAKNRRAELNYK